MKICLPVMLVNTTDEDTGIDFDARRVTVQLTEAEAEAVAGGDAAAVAEMGGIVGAALTDAGVGA